MQNFPQQLQTPISQKQKMFSGSFIAYLECASNLKHFEQKDEHPSLVIFEIIDSERVGYLNVSKVLLQNTIRYDTTIIVFFHEFEVK